MTPTNPTEVQMKLAREYACQAVEVYGEGDAREHDAAVLRTLWNDHPAVQSALLAIQATEARAQGLVDALEPLAKLELLQKFSYNTKTYSIFHKNILAARQALATWRRT